MLDNGLMDKWQKMYWPNSKICDTKNRVIPMGLSHMKGVFLTLLISLLVSAIFFMVELIWFKCCEVFDNCVNFAVLASLVESNF